MDLESVVPVQPGGHRRNRRRLLANLCVGAVILGALMVSIVSFALAASPTFPDVPTSHPYHDPIADLASRGIVKGYDNGNFGPGEAVRRQQFAKMIVKTLRLPVTKNDVCPFTDVMTSTPGSYVDPFDPFYPDHYVAVCADHGITQGKTATTLDPYGRISRFQVISMVVRALDSLHPGLLTTPPDTFTAAWDPAISPDHGQNARRAEYNGLLTGIDLTFLSPLADMTRGEIAQVLHNVLGKITSGPTTTTTEPCG